MHHRDKFFIGGEWVKPAGTSSIDVVNLSTEQVMGGIPEGNDADVQRGLAKLAGLIPGEVGMPLRLSAQIEVGSPIAWPQLRSLCAIRRLPAIRIWARNGVVRPGRVPGVEICPVQVGDSGHSRQSTLLVVVLPR